MLYTATYTGGIDAEGVLYYEELQEEEDFNYEYETKMERNLSYRHYELTNHLGNVLAVVSDRKIGVEDQGNPGTVKYYEADLVSAQDYYPFGMIMPGRSVSAGEYRYGLHGMERDDNWSGEGNQYTTQYRQYDSRLARWSSIDPIHDHRRSPYNAFGNNPVLMIDPDGLREFESYENYKEFAGDDAVDRDEMGSQGHWLTEDREGGTDVWDAANRFNLQSEDGYEEYERIQERTAFYEWFDDVRQEQGHEIEWVGIASVVSGQMERTETIPGMGMIFGGDVLDFAADGNEAIFNSVFSDLRGVYNLSEPLTGNMAEAWDAQTLYREQFKIVQPIYQKQDAGTIRTLSRMASGAGALGILTQGMLKFEGDIMDPQDRYDHGMDNVLDYYRLRESINKAYEGAGWR